MAPLSQKHICSESCGHSNMSIVLFYFSIHIVTIMPFSTTLKKKCFPFFHKSLNSFLLCFVFYKKGS